jgi:hypothetical protein
MRDVELVCRNPKKKAIWESARAQAQQIALDKAPLEPAPAALVADAAADAFGALVVLLPFGRSFERLYGPFSGVIPLQSLVPNRQSAPVPPTKTSPSRTSAGAKSGVDKGRAIGFFGDEIIVVVIFLFVGVPSAIVVGPLGLLLGGMCAGAAFFAMKASRGPIASIHAIQDSRNLNRLKASDPVTYESVQLWRGRATAVGCVLVVVVGVLVVLAITGVLRG